MSNRKQTSRAIAQLASDTLRDPHPSKRGKSLAGSALAQAKAKKAAKARAARA